MACFLKGISTPSPKNRDDCPVEVTGGLGRQEDDDASKSSGWRQRFAGMGALASLFGTGSPISLWLRRMCDNPPRQISSILELIVQIGFHVISDKGFPHNEVVLIVPV